MPRIKQYLFAFVLAFSFTACTDGFEAINTNNNAPEQVAPEFLLTNVLSVAADANAYQQGFRLSNYLAQFAASVEFERIDRYEMGSNSGYWNLIFQLLNDIRSMNQLPGTNEAYQAVGDILRAYLFSQLTDLWGDVPYTEAVQAGEGVFTPRYDTQESIYTDEATGILTLLRNAVTTLGNTNASISGDIMYGGNLEQWQRFANSLRVRYIMRISKRLTDFSELQALVDGGMLMRGNEDNALIPYLSAAPNQYPMSLESLGLYQEHRMTLTVDSVLTAWADPRIAVLYRPTQKSINEGSPAFRGLLNGQSRETIGASGVDLNDISLFGTIFRDVPDGADAQLMQYAELQFALAEAAERGFITNAPNAYYEQGVSGSFAYYQTAVPAGYFQQPGVVLDGNDNLGKILTQKWLSLINVGHEAWFNIRRTGIPALKPGPDNLNEGRYPVRYLYPESEQATNNTNYLEAAQRIGGDNINSQGWWEQ